MPAKWRRCDRALSDRYQCYWASLGHLTMHIEYFEGSGWGASVYVGYWRLWGGRGYPYAKRETAERRAVAAAGRLIEKAARALELATDGER